MNRFDILAPPNVDAQNVKAITYESVDSTTERWHYRKTSKTGPIIYSIEIVYTSSAKDQIESVEVVKGI